MSYNWASLQKEESCLSPHEHTKPQALFTRLLSLLFLKTWEFLTVSFLPKCRSREVLRATSFGRKA